MSDKYDVPYFRTMTFGKLRVGQQFLTLNRGNLLENEGLIKTIDLLRADSSEQSNAIRLTGGMAGEPTHFDEDFKVVPLP